MQVENIHIEFQLAVGRQTPLNHSQTVGNLAQVIENTHKSFEYTASTAS